MQEDKSATRRAAKSCDDFPLSRNEKFPVFKPKNRPVEIILQ
jgi:hypothetical protein